MYPFGNGNARNVYLSVFLEMGSRESGPRRYEYKVEMVNQVQQNSSVVREFSSEFESGECWGYNRFFRIDLLEKDGYLTMEDKLVFKFYVRSPSFYFEYQDQQRYIRELEKKLKLQEEQ